MRPRVDRRWMDGEEVVCWCRQLFPRKTCSEAGLGKSSLTHAAELHSGYHGFKDSHDF